MKGDGKMMNNKVHQTRPWEYLIAVLFVVVGSLGSGLFLAWLGQMTLEKWFSFLIH
jgi:hypothetical protein